MMGNMYQELNKVLEGAVLYGGSFFILILLRLIVISHIRMHRMVLDNKSKSGASSWKIF